MGFRQVTVLEETDDYEIVLALLELDFELETAYLQHVCDVPEEST